MPIQHYKSWKIISNPKNKKLTKYFKKRTHLFSKYKYGIIMDDESWYSVTDENLAKLFVKRIKKSIYSKKVLVGFCGVGSEVIQFCNEGFYVIACDISYQKLKYLKVNFEIYNSFYKNYRNKNDRNNMVDNFVNDDNEMKNDKKENNNRNGNKIKDCINENNRNNDKNINNFDNYNNERNYEIINEDFFNLTYQEDTFGFLTPPWGGINYKKLNLNNYFKKIIIKSKLIFDNFGIYFPRNIDINEFEDINFELIKYSGRIYGYLGLYGECFRK